jgi:hypothetical protein
MPIKILHVLTGSMFDSVTHDSYVGFATWRSYGTDDVFVVVSSLEGAMSARGWLMSQLILSLETTVSAG